jgi:hypothetical protein
MPKDKKQKINRVSNHFKTAVDATAEIAQCYQVGLQAMGKYSSKIDVTQNSKCDGSVDLDACTTQLYPTEHRWDYIIGYNTKVYFVEVHSAETSEVSTVLSKLQWLKDWIIEKAPEVNKIKANVPYFWVQSWKYNILPNSPQARRVAKQGLKPIPKLELK